MLFRKQLPLLAAAAMILGLMGASEAASDFMTTGSVTSQPVGHYELCARSPDECRQVTQRTAPVELTRDLWDRIIDINNEVNLTVIPRTDMELWGVEEFWSYPDAFGDCEDYVLEKRRLLMEAGVPAGNLLITVVRQPNGDGHAVLTINTSMGDYVLDNIEPRVLSWSQTQYEFLKRQSASNSGKWVSVNDGRSVAVGAVSSNR